MKKDNGFRKHISLLVDKFGDEPMDWEIKHCRLQLGEKAKVKWINVEGEGYDKNWMWVMGIE